MSQYGINAPKSWPLFTRKEHKGLKDDLFGWLDRKCLEKPEKDRFAYEQQS